MGDIASDTVGYLIMLIMRPLDPESSLNINHVLPITATGNAAKMTTSMRDAGEITTVGTTTYDAFGKTIAQHLVNDRYGWKSSCLFFYMDMVLTPIVCNLNCLEVLTSTPIGKIDNFMRGVDNIRTHVWNNVVELTPSAVEIERAKIEVVREKGKDGDRLFQEGVGRKPDSNGTGVIDDDSALPAAGLINAVLNEEGNGPEDGMFIARPETRQKVDAWVKVKARPHSEPQH